jgi:hypothetical protein
LSLLSLLPFLTHKKIGRPRYPLDSFFLFGFGTNLYFLPSLLKLFLKTPKNIILLKFTLISPCSSLLNFSNTTMDTPLELEESWAPKVNRIGYLCDSYDCPISSLPRCTLWIMDFIFKYKLGCNILVSLLGIKSILPKNLKTMLHNIFVIVALKILFSHGDSIKGQSPYSL